MPLLLSSWVGHSVFSGGVMLPWASYWSGTRSSVYSGCPSTPAPQGPPEAMSSWQSPRDVISSGGCDPLAPLLGGVPGLSERFILYPVEVSQPWDSWAGSHDVLFYFFTRLFVTCPGQQVLSRSRPGRT